MSDTKYCHICGKTNGILICNGCELIFCPKHMIKHREELEDQLDDIIEEHNLIQKDIKQSTNEYIYLGKIDKWERESIEKIQTIAQTARLDLKQIIQKSKKRLRKTSNKIVIDMKSSREQDDFSEDNLKKWIKQLNELQSEIKSFYKVYLIEDQRYPIYPIIIANNHLQIHSNIDKIHSNERFSKVINNASIENDGLIVKHTGPDSRYAHILGKKSYSQGRHTIQFKILESTLPYLIFFGCISLEMLSKSINYKSSSVVGWFGYNEVYQHGIWNNSVNIHGYDSDDIEIDDILHLTFDCDQKQIELFHERIKKRYKLSVNIDKAPFPWKLLVVLVHENDCVEIISNR